MKNASILPLLFLLNILLVCHSVSAQDYVVTTKGDTIYGEVKPLNYGPEKKVQIRAADKKKAIYSMMQIASFSLEKEVYQPVKGPTGYSFMKLLKGGYLSLYAFQGENQVLYDNYFLLKRDGKGTEIPNLSFKKVLSNFLSDCKTVSDKIEKGEYDKRDLEKIVDEYNSCLNAKTSEELPMASSPTLKNSVDQWQALAEKVNRHEAFEGKDNALEMIDEVKNKLIKSEKIPNFLIQGLKETITPPDLQDALQNALNAI